MNTEILEVDKAEHELTLQALHKKAEQLENEIETSNNLIIKEMSNNFLKQVEKEIEYCEFHIQELSESINFNNNRVEKGVNQNGLV